MIGINEIYSHSRKSKYPFTVSKKDYSKVISSFNKFLVEVLKENGEVNLPFIGKLLFAGKKQKLQYTKDGKKLKEAPDWKATRELWKVNEEARLNKERVYHDNFHTNGIRYKMYWIPTSIMRNRRLYKFIPARDLKRDLARLILDENKEYYVVE